MAALPSPGVVHPYATTHTITEHTDGRGVTVLRKDLSASALLPSARGVTPAELVDPTREVAVYRQLLPAAGVRTAVCHVAHADPDTGRAWLVLEKVAAPLLWQVGDVSVWCDVARWTAQVHRRLAPFAGAPPAPLLAYDHRYYALWPPRLQAAFAGAADSDRTRAEAVADVHRGLVARLLTLPRGVIHGELYPSNVLVDGERICIIDWEMAGIGPWAMDLAMLTTGWPAPQRWSLIAAYAEEAGAVFEALLAAVDLCELHVCVRMLAWAENWTPPVEHQHDWLSRAEVLAERLAL